MRQQVSICTSRDGPRIAYAVHGKGPPLVIPAHWATHVERDWDSPVWRPQLDALGERFTVTRYDARDSGLSDHGLADVSLDSWVSDLEAVVDSAGLDRFPLLAMDMGGPIAIGYAARHPGRVEALALLGTFALGRARRGASRAAEIQATSTLMDYSWDEANAPIQHLWTARMMPNCSPEQSSWLTAAQRAYSAAAAVRSFQTSTALDVRDQARALRLPVLVLHARGDAFVPHEAGRELCALIEGAHFVSLESQNHILRTDEPAWQHALTEIDGFLGSSPGAPPTLSRLTPRELELTDLMAAGLDNAAIAARLVISHRTVRNHISHIFQKLGVANRPEAIILAREAGLGSGEESDLAPGAHAWDSGPTAGRD